MLYRHAEGLIVRELIWLPYADWKPQAEPEFAETLRLIVEQIKMKLSLFQSGERSSLATPREWGQIAETYAGDPSTLGAFQYAFG